MNLYSSLQFGQGTFYYLGNSKLIFLGFISQGASWKHCLEFHNIQLLQFDLCMKMAVGYRNIEFTKQG